MVKVRRAKPKEKKEAKPLPKLSQFLDKKAEGRQNQYVFKGFYERLGSISAKLGHTNNKRYGYMREDEATRYLMGFSSHDAENEEQVQLTSNFISMVNCSTKLNASMEFKDVHSDLAQYTSSYNLVVFKKDEIVDKLINSIEFEDGKVKDSKLAVSIIDLLIALIKDLRTELTFETVFIDKIFPCIVKMIDVLDLELLEQIVSFNIHCFKFMLPSILKNFQKFYKIYFAVLRHSNKFIKKFAAESFSYVLRKAKLDQLPRMINEVLLQPIEKPYKYLKLSSSSTVINAHNADVDMKDDNEPNLSEEDIKNENDEALDIPRTNLKQFENVKDKTDCENNNNTFSSTSNVLDNTPFCQFEKFISNCIANKTFSRNIGENEYNYGFSFDEKLELIAIISMIFTEAIYGVQKKLYTEWTPFCDTLLAMISTENEELIPWYCNIFRFTMINLFSKLNTESISELTKYIINKIGCECSASQISSTNTIKLECCLLMIRDQFVYKEGAKLSSINTMNNVEFLYKLLKNQAKSNSKLSERCLNLLTECLYLGYYNKPDQFINVFDMNHTSKLTDLICSLGTNYGLHFFSLASMKEINQKFYDISRYNVMLLNRKAAILPAYYTTNEQKKMSLIFKPLAKILFSISDNKHDYLIPFLSIFIIIKNKIKECELLELPKKFINRIEAEIRKIELLISKEKIELSHRLTDELWIYSKVLSMSKCTISFDIILDYLEERICEHKNSYKNILVQKHGITDVNTISNITAFIPNIQPVLMFIKIKANILLVKYRNVLKIEDKSIFSYSIDPSEQYFKSILTCIQNSSEKDNLMQEYSEYFDCLTRFILCARSPVRCTVIEILKLVLNHANKDSDVLKFKTAIVDLPISASEADIFNPCIIIDLISNISVCDPGLDTEKSMINNLHRLQNIFRANNVPIFFQVIYLRFLISQFWYRFTLIYETTHSSIGELLELYHDSIIEEFEHFLTSIDTMLMIPPNDHKIYNKKSKFKINLIPLNSSFRI